jgi:DoxX-like family
VIKTELLRSIGIMKLVNQTQHQRKEILRVVLAIAIIIVGVTHFLKPQEYIKIVPPQLPHPAALVYISGVFEILGGIGLLIPFISVPTFIKHSMLFPSKGFLTIPCCIGFGCPFKPF